LMRVVIIAYHPVVRIPQDNDKRGGVEKLFEIRILGKLLVFQDVEIELQIRF